ncbi:MAG: DUF2169 family type VI secretion system accessory protein [Methylovirgula sp.]
MVRIIKPTTLGILLRTQRRGKGALYTISALGLFDVAKPGIFLSEQAMWPAVMKELPEGAVFDPGMPKPQGELLVAGHVKAPNGSAVRAMMLEIGLGSIAKRVAVFGDRYWMPGAGGFVFTEPQPFSEMKIDLRRMYGGANHPQNTLGVGYQAVRLIDAQQISPLPNFEDPRRLIRSVEETPPPVGLGPIDMQARDRMKYAGTFDKAWQENIAPHPPLDTDPRVYSMAPEDQRIAGYFVGDEPLRVYGMTGDEPSYAGCLPGLRARAFVMRTSEPAGLFELDMKLDTVLLLGSHRKGVVVFRGTIPVADVDAKDAAAVMIAYERIHDAPRPIEHYAEVYRLRTDPEQGRKYVFAESQLTPERSDAEKLHRRQAREEYTRAIAERFADGMHLMTKRQMALAGLPESLVPAKPEPLPLPVLLPTPEELECGDVDLAELIDGMETLGREAREKLEAIRDQAEAAQGSNGALDFNKLLKDLDGNAGFEAGPLRKSLEVSKAELPSLDELLATLADAPAEAKGRATDAAGIVNRILQDGMLDPPPAANDEAAFQDACSRFLEERDAGIIGKMYGSFDQARKTLGDLAPQDMPTSPKAPEPFSALMASLTSQPETDSPSGEPRFDATPQLTDIDRQLRAKFPALAARSEQSFEALLNDLSTMAPTTVIKSAADVPAFLDDAEQRVAGAEAQLKNGLAQLRRIAVEPTFPDQPLAPAVALRFGLFVRDQWRQGADLRGRDLAGADLSGMDLGGADLTGAFLERANLSRANLQGARCEQAVFAGTRLDGACFDDAMLNGANLSRVSAKMTSFKRANLENINAIEAKFLGADFEAARFAESQLIKANFTGARLVGALFKKMIFVQTPFDQVDASSAVFERCQIVDCSAEALRLRNGSFLRCAVVKFRAAQADFSGAMLDGTGFASGADLPGARFDGASLRGVTLQAANLTGASFIRARLDGAVVSESQIADSNFTCASLKRAQFIGADLSRCDFFAANFFEAQLRRANLRGARLRSANLYSTNFADSDLTGADLTASNHNKSQLALETSHGG